MKTTPSQRRQLDGILMQDMATLEKASFHPTADLLTRRLWPVWGKGLGLSGGSMLGLVNRQLKSLKIEGWVSDRIYPKPQDSRAPAWGLTDAGLAKFGLRRGGSQPPPPPPPNYGPRQTPGSGHPKSPGAGGKPGATGQGTAHPGPDARPEVPKSVYEAAVLLGVSPLAPPERIEDAYRRWAKSLHPDRNPNPGDSTNQLKRINGARDLLLEFSRSRPRR
jgi:DnaJ-like protein